MILLLCSRNLWITLNPSLQARVIQLIELAVILSENLHDRLFSFLTMQQIEP